MISEKDIEKYKETFGNQYWRLNNLYKVVDESGTEKTFKMRDVQSDFYNNIWYRNIILKARQLGFSTFIQILMLDCCLFNDNYSCGVIADTEDNAKSLLSRKFKFAYERVFEEYGDILCLPKQNVYSTAEVKFDNGSSIRVGVSLRGDTLNFLHVSELGKICAKNPDRADEVKTGSFNTVPKDCFIVVESTAEGSAGMFHDMYKKSKEVIQLGRKLTRLDYRLHFYPWYEDDKYSLHEAVLIDREHEIYFDKLEAETGDAIDISKRKWYVLKEEEQKDKMKQEFPSTPEEAFANTVRGAYFEKELANCRRDGRILDIPLRTDKVVYAVWDIGVSGANTITSFQIVDDWINIMWFDENGEDGLPAQTIIMKEREKKYGFAYGTCFLPHDGKNTEWASGQKRYEVAEELLPGEVVVLKRDSIKNDAIDRARTYFPRIRFHEKTTQPLLAHAANYKKVWNGRLGIFIDKPDKTGGHDHGVDGGILYLSQAVDMMDMPTYDDYMNDYNKEHDVNSVTGY